ncbi:MAG TPA: hypothetical protein VKR83_14055 [Ktedonobacteraceae bacterium]|nr:hypothetical protein [Ktedonobacteraceae bacterium]
MLCPECQTNCQANDVFCRRCGIDLSIPSTSLVPVTSNLPIATSHPQLPRLAAGVGALAFGFGLELLRRNLLSRLEKPIRSTSKALTTQTMTGIRDAFTQQQAKTLKLPKGYVMEETAIYINRVIRREK